jgi:hypothetical protein
VSAHNLGYDIESRDHASGRLRFIEVKGRRRGAETVTLTYNELHCALNSPQQFILALVEIALQGNVPVADPPRYVINYPFREPDRLAASINYDLKQLLALSTAPR